MSRRALVHTTAAIFAATGAALSFSSGCANKESAGDKAAPGLLSRGNEHDVQVSLEEVPAAVRATAEARFAGGTINEIERSTTDGRTVYEFEIKGQNGMFDIAVAEDGTYLGMDDDDGPDDDDDDGDDDDDDGDDDDPR